MEFTNRPMSEYGSANQSVLLVLLAEIRRLGGDGSRMAREIRDYAIPAEFSHCDNEAWCLECAARAAEGKSIVPIPTESKNVPDSSDS